MKTPMIVVAKKLREHSFLESIHDSCVVCVSDPDSCVVLKCCVQNLMNQGNVQFSRSKVVKEIYVIEPITIIYRNKKIEAPLKRIQPIHICVPSSFSYQDTKAVPWTYDTTAYIDGKEIQFSDADIVSIAGTGGMIRSGHVFSPKYTHRLSLSLTFVPPIKKVFHVPPSQERACVPTTPVIIIIPAMTRVTPDKDAELETSKGKGLMNEVEQIEGHKKSTTAEEGQEFFKLIKKSDFEIVDQLGQTPSKISIMSMMLSYEDHQK